jgi:hypothetical protein
MARRKAKKTAAVKKITTITLFQKAKRDPDFLNALLRDPGRALAKKGLTLSPKDLKWLKRAFKKVYKINGKRLVRMLVEGKNGEEITMPWPKISHPWPGFSYKPWP